MTSIGSQFSERRTNGFDYLRIILAISVICAHTITTSFGKAGDAYIHGTLFLPVCKSIMPIFFALSGFLVASSLDRLPDLRFFLMARSLRIFPALIVEVILSALVIGPIFTVLPLAEYFTGRTFYSYLTNSVGWIHYYLPGVFESNPDSGIVNRSLWTVPSELECYILLSAIFILGIFRRKTFVFVFVVLAILLSTFFTDPAIENSQVIVSTKYLALAFLCGVLMWKFRGSLPSGAIYALISYVLVILFISNPWTISLACLSAAYFAATAGCLDINKNKLLASGDYSYGIYLYAYPIQQISVFYLGPNRPFLSLLISLAIIPIFAAFSWHMVEKRILKFKNRIQKNNYNNPNTTKPIT